MKNILLFLSILFISCEENTVDLDSGDEIYLIEGKWLPENAVGIDLLPNTMYEFKNGLRYTYYCTSGSDCDWRSLVIADAIPNPKTYIFEENKLTIDGDIIFNIEFECNGTVANTIFNDSKSQMWRIGTDLADCN
ncbi:MAG: Uncharacterised protein [Polaribacter sp. SA4-10]|nr:MAG: Uncharacterised protein [Polaribacter sp. SA4-10]|tara:strand:- start:2077 stop:2481 length:405 start_codon:yes stop_codon:yes gene_type:complete